MRVLKELTIHRILIRNCETFGTIDFGINKSYTVKEMYDAKSTSIMQNMTK